MTDLAATQLVVSDLRVDYYGALALRGVSITIGQGEVTALVGPNGAGKSTLANTISGLVRPRSGSISLNGSDLSRLPAGRRARAGIGLLPDDRGIFPALSVEDNLRMAFRLKPKNERKLLVSRAMSLFPVLGQRRRQIAGSLSGGEQQMLAVARFVVDPPKVLIADELSHGLAPVIVDGLYEQLLSIRNHSAVLLIEQFVDRALAAADQVVVLRQGEVVFSGRVSEIDRAGVEALYAIEGAAAIVGRS